VRSKHLDIKRGLPISHWFTDLSGLLHHRSGCGRLSLALLRSSVVPWKCLLMWQIVRAVDHACC